MPGENAAGEDRFLRVRVQPDGSPLVHVFRYLLIEHDDGRRELALFRAGVEHPSDVESLDPHDSTRVTVGPVRDLADRFERLERFARTHLAVLIGADIDDDVLAGRSRERRELTDEFLADIARRYQEHEKGGRPPTQTIAREERVGTSTVKNWVRKARERDLLEGQS